MCVGEGGIQAGLGGGGGGGGGGGPLAGKQAGSSSASKPHAPAAHSSPQQPTAAAAAAAAGLPQQRRHRGSTSSASPIQVRHAVVTSRAEGRFVPCGCGTSAIRIDFCSAYRSAGSLSRGITSQSSLEHCRQAVCVQVGGRRDRGKVRGGRWEDEGGGEVMQSHGGWQWQQQRHHPNRRHMGRRCLPGWRCLRNCPQSLAGCPSRRREGPARLPSGAACAARGCRGGRGRGAR